MDYLTAARVFVTLHSSGSLAADSESLEIYRPMVSRYLSIVEKWAGARLYHRTTRRISLTAAGEAALTHCRALIEIADRIPLVADQVVAEPRGLLRIACSQPLAQSLLARAVNEYLLRHPQVTIDLQILNRTVDLVAERIDVAVRICNEIDPMLIAKRLGTCESVICASANYLMKRGVPEVPEDLASHNCLTYSHFGRTSWQFEKAGSMHVVAVNGNLTGDDSVTLLHATLAGSGIAMQPAMSALPLIRSGELVQLLADYRPQPLGIYAIYTSRSYISASMRTMLDFLSEWFQRELAAFASAA